jgi:putative colanic acid biosynthesis acetyltransferase WcaF
MKEYVNNIPLENKLYRFAWNITWRLIFKNIPGKKLNFIRIGILRLFGSKVGKKSGVYCSTIIWSPRNLIMGEYSWIGPKCNIYNVGKIIIENNVTISQYCYLNTATHDYNSKSFDLIVKNTVIQDGVWIGAAAFISLGVTIGENSIIGAKSAVFKSIEPNIIVGGNPAKKLKLRQ